MEVNKEEKSLTNKIDQIYFDYVTTKSIKIRNQIVKQNQALVTFIINKYYSNKKEYENLKEDMIQEGIIGLLSAIEGYKPDLGYRFSTYSTWWIRQAINNYLLNVEPIIHVPSHIRTANNKMQKKLREENMMLQDYIRNADARIREEDGCTDKMLHSITMANRSRNVSSLDEQLKGTSEDRNITVRDTLVSDENIELKYETCELIGLVKNALAALTDKERYIILLRFNVIDDIKKEAI
ncbi:sigma-70 family RNA polymerase sigma factor [bacterium]|nr:sigma-70 family RNA polymerase sigma factor [Candidatus Elulimicrobium humile]